MKFLKYFTHAGRVEMQRDKAIVILREQIALTEHSAIRNPEDKATFKNMTQTMNISGDDLINSMLRDNIQKMMQEENISHEAMDHDYVHELIQILRDTMKRTLK